jgi:hypothetical protein
VGLTDLGYEQDETRTVDLPFSFRYYGRDYAKLSICSNGWAALGETSLVSYRNWTIPSAESPDALIAPFWDDLYMNSGSDVAVWNDGLGHRVVVEWSLMRNDTGNAIESFELILYDPAFHPTATGDGEIRFQYATVNDLDQQNGYATVGIQDPTGGGGLLWTYWNVTTPGSALLVDHRAIRFLPVGNPPRPVCQVEPASIALTLSAGESAQRTLTVTNAGEQGSILRYLVEELDPNLPGGRGEGGAPDGAPGGDRSILGSTLAVEPTSFIPGVPMDFTLSAFNGSSDGERLRRVELILPAGVTLNSATDMVGGSAGPLSFYGPTGEGVLTVWQSNDATGKVLPGESAAATMNLSFGAVPDTLNLYWRLLGDIVGGNPHVVQGSIQLTITGAVIWVLGPNGGEIWHQDEEREILFHAAGGPTNVDVAIRRGDDAQWEPLATGLAAADGVLPWTVTGPPAAGCRVRVSDSADPGVFDESDFPFTIGHSLAWLDLDTWSGELPAGGSDELQLAIDASGLAPGVYEAALAFHHNAGLPLTVMVTLTVEESGTAIPGDASPPALALGQNHPNPFNPRTTLPFSLAAPGRARLALYDAAGRLVRVLLDQTLPAGSHRVDWDGRDGAGRPAAAGVYLARLECAGQALQRRLVLLK